MVPRRPDSAPYYGKGTPGPGQYSSNFNHKRQAPRFGFGTQEKAIKLNKDQVKNPGAGTYSPTTKRTMKSTPSYKIGTEVRGPLSQVNKNPGPGMYRPRTSFDGPKWGMKGRKSVEHDELVPGPGTYNPSDKSTK